MTKRLFAPPITDVQIVWLDTQHIHFLRTFVGIVYVCGLSNVFCEVILKFAFTLIDANTKGKT